MDKLDLYTSIVPTTAQKIAQRHTFNVFIHYGMNTFTGKEWGTGKESAQLFNPSAQDTDQWLRCIAASGASGVILTCKHHDGFCLWPTETTAHSVKHSPYKDGKGDVVREVSDSCRKYGLRFGVYLSPWDRNHSTYGSEAYNDVYCRQLTELLTNYGEIFCVWLDGACGSYMDNKPKQHYDFDRIYALVRELAPNAVISNCGPDIRWVGNEGGIARKSEWNVVPAFACDTQSIAEQSQHADGEDMVKNMRRVDDDNEKIAYLRSCTIGKLVKECTTAFLANEDAILDGSLDKPLIELIEPRPRDAYRACTETAYAKIYRSKQVLDVEMAGYKVIYTLLELLIEAVTHPDKAYSKLLIKRVSEQYEIDAPTLYGKIMAVLDYISGMTDVYALDLYRKIIGNSLPSV